MKQPKDYDWEEQRINAFLIMNNKLYEAKIHLECFGKALNIDISDYQEDFDVMMEDLEEKGLENMVHDYILGEVANINGKKSIICVGDMKRDRNIIGKYYKDIYYENYYD
jgi:hypothetical protein